MAVSNDTRKLAKALKYNQRKALMRLASGAPEQRDIGPRSREQLLNSGFAVFEADCCLKLKLTDAGRQMHDALEELGWLPPD